MLYLLDKDVKTVKWNGIPLHEASSAIVKEEVNGDFVLTVHYPITDSGVYQLIKEDMLIKAPVPVIGPQLFRIKKPIENDDSLDITAYHITDDVMQRSITPVSVVGQGCAMALSQMIQNAKTGLGDFSFTSDIMDSRTFNTTETETLYSVLLDGKHSIVGTWEGELVRDNFSLSIKRSRGADRGVVITTHKNLKSYQRTKNSQGVVTRIHARSTFREEGAETDTVLTVTVDSPLINSYPYINEKEYENNDVKTIDELKKWAEAKFKNEGIDKVSDAIEIEAYELDGQVVHLGDTVNIKSRKHNVDIYKKAIAYEYNALTEEYISITFDDKPGVGGSGVSSGVSNAADVILGVNKTAQEVAIERAVKNANQAFDTEFNKRVEVINDGIKQAKAGAELYADTIKQSIDADINVINQSMQAQSEEHDRQVADILSKTQSVESLANQAKTDAANAVARANQVKTEAIADATAQVATVSQALNIAKTDLQNQVNAVDAKAVKVQSDATSLRTDLDLQASKILEQAQAQTALASRVTTVETLADGTRSTVAELSKTVSKATGDIASVTSRTKTVEDTLSQTRTQYEALSQTVNAQTGQIDSINRKTADLQSGIDGVTERFDNLQVGNKNYLPTSRVVNRGCTNFRYNETSKSWSMTVPTGSTSQFGHGITFNTSGLNILLNGGETLFFGLMIKANKACSFNYDINNYLPGSPSNDNDDRSKQAWSPSNKSLSANVWTRVWFSYTAKDNVPITESNSNFGIVNNTDAVDIEIKEVIVAKSKVPVDYQSPDEDTVQQIAEYKKTADQNYSGLQSTISTLDGKVAQNKTEANQTATQLSNRLTSLETYKDGESTRAQTYFEASKTETAKQITAERTAIAANYIAKSIYNEDARGTTLKLNEIKTTADTAKQNLATYQETVDRKLTELTTSTQTLDGKISTASAKVDTVAGQIRTEISTVEGKIPKSAGTRNLLKGTKELTNIFPSSSITNEYFRGYRIARAAQSTEPYVDTYRASTTIVSDASDYILSFYAKSSIDGTSIDNFFYGPNTTTRSESSTGYIGTRNDGLAVINLTTTWKRYWIKWSQTPSDSKKTVIIGRNYRTNNAIVDIAGMALYEGSLNKDWSRAPEDYDDEISSVKTAITQTSQGVEQLSTSLSTTNNKVSIAETKINQLIGDVSSRVSRTEYNTLTGRVSNAETAITQNATEISRRLTSTQVESAITGKGYQTKSDVDNNITGRGYITNSALQPYALTTTVQNLVKETADSFSRTISETRALIPTSAGTRNLLKGTKELTNIFPSSSITNEYFRGYRIARAAQSTEPYVDTYRASTTIVSDASDYILSFYAKSSIDGTSIDNFFYGPNTTTRSESSTGYIGTRNDGLAVINLTTTWKRYWIKWSQTPSDSKKTVIIGRNYRTNNAIVDIAGMALYEGSLNKDWSRAPEDYDDEISSVKTAITQTSQGVEQLSTSLSTTNNKVSIAETKINQLIGDVSSRVSRTEYNTLTGRVSNAETAITQNATEISRRLTSTQVESAITGKGYQTKSDVDNNITGRGYITNSALQPYALTTTVQNLVKETADSFSRTIGAVGTTGSILDNVSKVTQTAEGLVQEVSGSNGLKTQVSTLAGSYAIKNLTNAGDVLGQINLNPDGSVRINEGLISVGTKTYIQDGVISSAKIGSLDAGKITTGTLDAARIATNSITGSHIVFDQAFVNKMTANEAVFRQLFAQSAFITSVQAVTLSASKISGGMLKATNEAMEINLGTGSVNFFTDSPAIRRSVANLPNQFVKFATANEPNDNTFKVLSSDTKTTVRTSVTSIGTNRSNGEQTNDGSFTGLNIYASGPATGAGVADRIGVHSDVMIVSHSVSEGQKGWVFENHNASNNVYAIRPMMPRGLSNYSSYIGTDTHPITRLFADDVMLNRHRLKGILKDIANRIGKTDGWAADIS